ncbi:MAG TPA: peptidylprolyl isomerase, partial [Sulfuricurvum sp.]|nr:peptidylprolyl isomerase [Sulfuricurvum sp.]
FQADEKRPELPVRYESEADYIQAFRAVSVPGTAFIRTANGKQSNLAYVRVRMPEGREDVVFSIVINRWHDNVAFMFDEASRLNPAKDDADFIFDFVGSYPNILIDLKLEDAPAFFELIQHYKDTPEYRRRFFTFAVNRGDPRFWEAYDWFQQRFEQMHPFEAGLFDLNRYYRVAFQKEYDRESE